MPMMKMLENTLTASTTKSAGSTGEYGTSVFELVAHSMLGRRELYVPTSSSEYDFVKVWKTTRFPDETVI